MQRRLAARGWERRGVAAVELALLLPLLAVMLVVTVDFARVFYFGMVLDGCARNGALYGQNTVYDPASRFPSLQAAVLTDADANGMTPAPTVAVGYGSTPGGLFTPTKPSSPGYVRVTVAWTFTTLVQYPGIPSRMPLTRMCLMPIPSASPVSN